VSTDAFERLRAEGPAAVRFPAKARAYLFVTFALAAGAIAATSTVHVGNVRWADFAVLLIGGAVAQLFAAHTPANQVFHTGLAFSVAAALVLPPQLVVAVCIGQHLPEWLRRRYPWYIPSFNIANVVLSGLAAWTTRDVLANAGWNAGARTGTAAVVAAACAGLVFVLVNHALLARMLMLARGHELDATGLFGLDGLIVDLVLAGIGVAMAFALRWQPALAPAIALPLILIHRALVVPSLREQVFRDHKTGLLNSRGIEKLARDELARAHRFDRPLSILMCDADGLREINNSHGHLAGDAALLAIADAFRTELRDYDLCARFGGDEFMVVLPETELEEALAVAARIHDRLGRQPLTGSGGTFSVSVSIGAASRSTGDFKLGDLIARADAAMYDAKRAGGTAALTSVTA
jgi:diguanylate cyclase (GGDEF)-like protein